MKNFAKRNILIYFRDIRAILFSLLGVFIVVALYALVLAKNLAESFAQFTNPNLLVAAWLMGGLCSIAPVSTALGAMGALVTDRANGANRDFLITPVAYYKLVGGYLAGGLLACTLLSLAVFGFGGLWLWGAGAQLPGPLWFLAIAGTLLLNNLAGGCMVFFIVTLLRTNAALSAVSTIVGTLLGFLTGIYLPIGMLPAAMQWVVRIFPVSHGAVLLRYLLLQGPAAGAWAGLPQQPVAEAWELLGVRFSFGGTLFPLWGSAGVLAFCALLFFSLSLISFRLGSRR